MNDEIIEIIDTLQECINNSVITDFYYKNEVDRRVHITSSGCKVLLDYITNLQQENQELNDSITWWNNRFNAVQRDYEELKQENERLKKMNMHEHKYGSEMEDKYINAKSRIEKAVEYISNLKPLSKKETECKEIWKEGYSDKDIREFRMFEKTIYHLEDFEIAIWNIKDILNGRSDE